MCNFLTFLTWDMRNNFSLYLHFLIANMWIVSLPEIYHFICCFIFLFHCGEPAPPTPPSEQSGDSLFIWCMLSLHMHEFVSKLFFLRFSYICLFTYLKNLFYIWKDLIDMKRILQVISSKHTVLLRAHSLPWYIIYYIQAYIHPLQRFWQYRIYFQSTWV